MVPKEVFRGIGGGQTGLSPGPQLWSENGTIDLNNDQRGSPGRNITWEQQSNAMGTCIQGGGGQGRPCAPVCCFAVLGSNPGPPTRQAGKRSTAELPPQPRAMF